MKWRNQMLALFCLFVFLGFGVLYFRYWVVQKPFGIILFIAAGLDGKTLAAARVHAGGAGTSLAIESLPYTAFLKNYSADSPIPDPAAAATAIATGVKVKNGTVAVDAEGRPLTSLLTLAQDAGRMTGLISDGSLTTPTAASFYGHSQKKEAWDDFARQLVESSEIDLVLGRGRADFLPKSQGGRRADENNLLNAASDAGYDYVQSVTELDAIPRWRRARLLGLFDEKEAGTGQNGESEAGPTLSDMVRRGIELLQYHRGGYVLVIDATSMRSANEATKMAATLELDRAIAIAKEYTEDNSAIVVTSDVAYAPISEKGTNKGPGEGKTRIAIRPNAWLPLNEEEDAFAEFSVLPPAEGGELVTPGTSPSGPDELQNSARSEIAEDVPVFGKGLGADAIHGTKESTELFEIIRDNL